jgi:hypothetical protein
VLSGMCTSLLECATDDDCEIAADCCNCQVVPKGTRVATCRVACGSNECEVRGLFTHAECTLGRCTLAVSCDARRVTCDALPPACTGQVPSVGDDGCWGPCVTPSECSDVTDCNACGDDLCVKFPNVGGITFRCIPPRAECEPGSLCECLAPCGGFGCSEENGEVGCYCVAC